MAAKGKFRFGYRATLAEGRTRAYVLIQRDLGPTELRKLEEDMRRLSAGLGKATAALIEFDVPLSRPMSRALVELSQKLELPVTLSVPPRHPAEQGAFGNEFAALETSSFGVEIRRESE